MHHKYCSNPNCAAVPVIRVQPFKCLTWDYYCGEHWIQLCLMTVKDAHDSGYIVVDKDDVPALSIVGPSDPKQPG